MLKEVLTTFASAHWPIQEHLDDEHHPRRLVQKPHYQASHYLQCHLKYLAEST